MVGRALLFPGQGAQHPGMAAELIAEIPAARQMMERANDVLGFDLATLCREGPADRLEATDVCQPAILATSAAVVEALRSECGLSDAPFAATAGLSLGEYSALWFAGSLDFDDALRLVRRRGEAMQEASAARESGMLSLLGADREQAARLVELAALHGVIVAANFLGPGQIALSGEASALDAAESMAREVGVRRAIRLKVAGAFHSPLMATATAALTEALRTVEIRSPRVPFFTNVTGDLSKDPEQIRTHLASQVTSPVLWEETMARFVDLGIDAFVEPAPGKVLTGLARKVSRDATLLNVETTADLKAYV